MNGIKEDSIIDHNSYSVIHVIVYIDLMNKEIEGAVEGVKSFYG
jgi:hypothetical protein